MRRRTEQRYNQIGELIPRQAAGFVLDIGKALRCELDGVEYVEIDVQPPPVHVTGQLRDRAASCAGRVVGDLG